MKLLNYNNYQKKRSIMKNLNENIIWKKYEMWKYLKKY